MSGKSPPPATLAAFARDPLGILAAGRGDAVAVVQDGRVLFYCVPAGDYEAMLDAIEDAELNAIADARRGGPEVKVDLKDL